MEIQVTFYSNFIPKSNKIRFIYLWLLLLQKINENLSRSLGSRVLYKIQRGLITTTGRTDPPSSLLVGQPLLYI